MHDSSKNIFQKVPFGLGWRTHFNFCVATLPDLETASESEPVLKKAKQFTIFEFIKKQSNEDVVSDCDTPQSCLLTEFHVSFAYLTNITVVSRLNQQVVYFVSVEPLKIREISFDILMGRILLTTTNAPVLYSTFENEKVDAWRQLLAKGNIEEALRHA